MIPSKDDKIVIVGAGCFGMSTTYHLLKRGFTDITVLERSDVLPAVDGSSNDFNRIVRSSYSDSFYAKLACDAIQTWKTDMYKDAYHECGVLVVGSNGQSSYKDAAFGHDKAMGLDLSDLPTPEALQSSLPKDIGAGTFEGYTGYLNRNGGWAMASQGLELLTEEARTLGAKILTGKTVGQLIRKDGQTKGVICTDGSTYEASLVVLATGAWTGSAFNADLDCTPMCTATGQSVAMVQLTEEEAVQYRKCPVVLDFSSGFYVFPPNAKNVVKMAIHNVGVTNKGNAKASTPRTIITHPVDGLAIPKISARALRAGLRKVYPALAERPFVATRLCWYNDTPDGDWLIGRSPADPGLLFATGDSGHAYKFLPVIGGLVADAVQGTLSPELTRKFAVDRVWGPPDASREGYAEGALEIDPEDLIKTAEDLLPDA
ncbi:FAD dependent oxidoreductase [Schizophyllum amplum]|uniref:FAD dependent oxidoreductase n=1 Tax=Schizophyllum amplum TaxID=97359 RepID=A0A550CWH4_9AGAR|nr:FAD dependent oxidoreductase [Auriculariopsis ampla]